MRRGFIFGIIILSLTLFLINLVPAPSHPYYSCDAYFEGYYYDSNLNDCVLGNSSSCEDPSCCEESYYYFSKEHCRIKNVKSCGDSDGGKDYSTKGIVNTGTYGCYDPDESGPEPTICVDPPLGNTDKCVTDSILKEYYCDPDIKNKISSINYTCTEGCEDGACLIKEGAGGPSGEETSTVTESGPGGEGGRSTGIVVETIEQTSRIGGPGGISTRVCPSGCECTSSVIECLLEDGTRTLTITAGASGNIIIQIKGVEVRTSVVLYHQNGKIYGEFKGIPKELKVLPDEAKEKVEEEIETEIEEEEIELDEDGDYNIKAKKRSRLFFVIPVSEKIQTTVNSETGLVGKVNAPWWGFLAKNV